MLTIVNDNQTTSKKRKFIKVDDNIVHVTNDYKVFKLLYSEYLEKTHNIILKEVTLKEIFLEVLYVMFEHREWSINNEPIIDIMDVAIAEDLNIDTYFDFQDIMDSSPYINEIFDRIVTTYSNFNMVDYVANSNNELQIILIHKEVIKPHLKIYLPLTSELEVMFRLKYVDVKDAFTLLFVSRMIDIALEIITLEDNSPNLDESILDLITINKLYVKKPDEIDMTNTTVKFEYADLNMLKRVIKIFVDRLIIEKIPFKTEDSVIETIVNNMIVVIIRGA
jgi:hypothetical protein